MKKKKSHFILWIALLAADFTAINTGLLFAYWIRFYSNLIPVVYGVPSISSYVSALPIISVILLFIMRSYGLYAIKTRLSIIDEFFMILKSVTVCFVISTAATFVYREFSYSRGVMAISWFVLVFFILINRFIINRLRFLARKINKDITNLLIIGTGPTTTRLIKHISGNPHWSYKICGIVCIEPTHEKEILNIPVLGALDEIANILSRRDIDEVILTVSSLPRQKIFDLIIECEKRMIEFKLIADLLGMVTSNVDMRNIDGIPLLGLKESPLVEAHNRFIKRLMDVTVSALGLILLSPFFIIIAIFVKLSSPGPVFYMQKRIGEDGRRFTILKFRTMKDKAEKDIRAVWAKKDDPRRTKTGAFLRSHNLDELPQLINVLRADMSLVGPRPERPRFVRQFKENIPRYMSRHKIRSGVTGWAQVNGLRGDTSIEERTKYDIYYIENWSLILDIKILFISVLSIFRTMRDAY
ncbi:MAG: undecaprenyl-phosphate glucose phosphotransferase [Candidatus Omnitrophota bacterium]